MNTDIIKLLPECLIDYIKDYLSPIWLFNTNKKYYLLYHQCIYESRPYSLNNILDTIKRDNYFVFLQLVRENVDKWEKIRHFYYKKAIFSTFLSFIKNYCIENNSIRCEKKMRQFLYKEKGLGKNIHKKNIINNIHGQNIHQ